MQDAKKHGGIEYLARWQRLYGAEMGLHKAFHPTVSQALTRQRQHRLRRVNADQPPRWLQPGQADGFLGRAARAAYKNTADPT